MVRTADAIEAEVRALAGKGLEAAAVYLEGRIREVLSVPAPRRTATAGPRSKHLPPGTRYYVATTPATPGAPPRKLSGTLRARVTRQKVGAGAWRVGVWRLAYARRHETGAHPYLVPTLRAELGNLSRIVGQELAGTFGG